MPKQTFVKKLIGGAKKNNNRDSKDCLRDYVVDFGKMQRNLVIMNDRTLLEIRKFPKAGDVKKHLSDGSAGLPFSFQTLTSSIYSAGFGILLPTSTFSEPLRFPTQPCLLLVLG